MFSKLGDQVWPYLIDLSGFGRSEKIDPSVPLHLAGDPGNPDDDIPIAVLVGKDEALLNAQYLFDLANAGAFPTLWNGKIIEVPSVGHAIQYERPSMFNQTLLRFVVDVIDPSAKGNGGGKGTGGKGLGLRSEPLP